MKLLAYAPRDAAPTPLGTRLGLLTDDGIRDLTAATGARDVGELLASGRAVEEADGGELIDPATVALRAPIARPGKIICVGLNYHDHCREQGVEPPAYPPLFAKFANAIADPGQAIVRPRATEQLDLECELAVVIGRRASRIGREEALDHAFGFTILNDITMRDLQREDRRWLRAKGSDGFAPIGPVVVTARRARRHLGAAAPLGGQRRDVAGLEHRGDDLRRGDDHRLRLADDHPGAGRHHRHRHAGGSRPLPASAPLPSRTATGSAARSRGSACSRTRSWTSCHGPMTTPLPPAWPS